jgi:drug/metabolite transporter (DMT)-like permease
MQGYPAVLAFGVICQFTALGTVALMLLLGRERGAEVLGFGGFDWFMLVSSAMIGIAVSHVMYYAAITRLGVAVSMGIVQLQPVITATASVGLGWERLTAWQWGAGLVGVAGAMVMLSATGRKRVEEKVVAEGGE